MMTGNFAIKAVCPALYASRKREKIRTDQNMPNHSITLYYILSKIANNLGGQY